MWPSSGGSERPDAEFLGTSLTGEPERRRPAQGHQRPEDGEDLVVQPVEPGSTHLRIPHGPAVAGLVRRLDRVESLLVEVLAEVRDARRASPWPSKTEKTRVYKGVVRAIAGMTASLDLEDEAGVSSVSKCHVDRLPAGMGEAGIFWMVVLMRGEVPIGYHLIPREPGQTHRYGDPEYDDPQAPHGF